MQRHRSAIYVVSLVCVHSGEVTRAVCFSAGRRGTLNHPRVGHVHAAVREAAACSVAGRATCVASLVRVHSGAATHTCSVANQEIMIFVMAVTFEPEGYGPQTSH